MSSPQHHLTIDSPLSRVRDVTDESHQLLRTQVEWMILYSTEDFLRLKSSLERRKFVWLQRTIYIAIVGTDR